MSVELYLIPVVHPEISPGRYANAPKYLRTRFDPNNVEPGLEDVAWAWTTYLLEDTGLLIAEVTPSQNNQLSGHSDVLHVPPLDNTINNTNQRSIVRNALEDSFIPAHWVNVGMTYREIIRTVLHIFEFHGRAVAINQGPLFRGDTLNLDLTVGDIPLGKVQALQQAADEFELDYSSVTNDTTIRQLLKVLADQFEDVSFGITGSGLELFI